MKEQKFGRLKRAAALGAMVILISSCSNPEGDFKKAEQANTEQAYAEFVQKHPQSPLVAEAKARMEKGAYEVARGAATVAAYQVFLTQYETGDLAERARAEVDALEFAGAGKAASIAAWRAFLSKYPNSTNSAAARSALAELVLVHVSATNTISGYETFITQFPGTPAATNAQHRIEMLDYAAATNANDITSYESFLRKHLLSSVIPDVQTRLQTQLEERDWAKTLAENTPKAYHDFIAAFPEAKRLTVANGLIHMEMSFLDAEGRIHTEDPQLLVTCDTPKPSRFALPVKNALTMGVFPWEGNRCVISQSTAYDFKDSEIIATVTRDEALKRATLRIVHSKLGKRSPSSIQQRPPFYIEFNYTLTRTNATGTNELK